MKSKPRIIHDSTLTDSAQTRGIEFSLFEKLAIAQALGDAGVHEIDIGSAAMCDEGIEEMRKIAALGLKSRLVVSGQMRDSDLLRCLSTGVGMVSLSIPVSDQYIQLKRQPDRKSILNQISCIVRQARDAGVQVAVCAEDASRADQSFVLNVAEVAQVAGARRLCYADTFSVLDPFESQARISRLVSETDLEVEMQAHDGLGMATANSLAAYLAGASVISTSMDCVRDDPHGASLKHFVSALWQIHQVPSGIDLQRLACVSTLLDLATGRTSVAQNRDPFERLMNSLDLGDHVGFGENHQTSLAAISH